MAVVSINIEAQAVEPMYNSILLSYYPNSDVCTKTQSEYQIQNVSFDASSLIYLTNNEVATNGWYSDGTNKAYWDGTALSSFTTCYVAPSPSTIQVSSGAGIISNQGPVYGTVRNAATGDYSAVEPSVGRIGQWEHLGSYTIERAFMKFDTSSITATPSAVNLMVYTGTADILMRLLKATESLVSNVNFGQVDWDSVYGDTPTASLENNYKFISLSALAISDLMTNGMIEIAIVSEEDYNQDLMNPGDDLRTPIDFVTNKAYLDITY